MQYPLRYFSPAPNRWFVILLLIACCSACFTGYYGYSSQQWDAMTEQQQTEAKADYAQVLQTKKSMADGDAIDARKDQVIKKGVTGRSGPVQTIRPTY